MAGNAYLSVLTSGVRSMVRANQTSAGAGDAGKVVALNSSGKIDTTMLSTHKYPQPLDVGVPALASLTQVNISGTGSVVENPGVALSIVDTSPPNDSSLILRGLAQAVPGAAPYRVAFYMLPDMLGVNYMGFGVGFRDSSSGAMVVLVLRNNDYFELQSFSSPTTRTTIINSFGPSYTPPVTAGIWMAVRDDNAGNVIWEISNTGAFWVPVASIVKSSYLTNYSQVCPILFCDDNTDTPAKLAAVSVLCWDVNAISGRKVGVAQ